MFLVLVTWAGLGVDLPVQPVGPAAWPVGSEQKGPAGN